MQLHYLGKPSLQFLSTDCLKSFSPLNDQPLFQVDGLVIFDPTMLTELEITLWRHIEASGRPIIIVKSGELPPSGEFTSNQSIMEQFSHRPRTNYVPVDCSFYDRLEAVIVSGETINLKYAGLDGLPVTEQIRVKDTKTHRKEEFLQFANGDYIRMDRIITVDGIGAGDICTI